MTIRTAVACTETLITAILLALTIPSVHAGIVVLPNGFANTVANDNSGNIGVDFASGDFQDIWDKSQFTSLGGPVLITELAYRLKPRTGALTATVTEADLFMSTTTVSPLTMSTTFAANRGVDYTKVETVTGTLWSSPGCTGPSPCPFDIIFTFTTPFLYNPSNGNLLIETVLTGYHGVGSGEFDVENYFPVPPVIPPIGELTVVPAAPVGVLEYSDNVTRLGFTAVPEPATLALLGIGLAGLGLLRRPKLS